VVDEIVIRLLRTAIGRAWRKSVSRSRASSGIGEAVGWIRNAFCAIRSWGGGGGGGGGVEEMAASVHNERVDLPQRSKP